MIKTIFVAAAVAVALPLAARAQSACGAATSADTIVVRASDYPANTSGQDIISQAITKYYRGPATPLVLKLEGTFPFTDKLTIDKSCLTITSNSTAAPANLIGNFTAASISAEKDGWFFRTPASIHDLTLSNLVTTNGGFEINGANIVISGNRMSGMRRNGMSTLILIGNIEAYDDVGKTLPSNRNFTVTGNTLSDANGGIGGGFIRDSLISQNTLQNVDQGIGFLYYARNNKITGNRGSGFKRMAVELLGNREPATASANLYGNSVTNNVFTNWIRNPLLDADPKTLTAEQSKSLDGLLSGISVAKGVNTTVSGNTVICGAACTVRASAGNALGDLNGMGIEAAGVNAVVTYNTVQNFAVGIWPSRAQAGDPIASTLVTNNKISHAIHGISQQCSGVQQPDVAGCNRNLVISNNTISEARDYAIGGDSSWNTNASSTISMSISTLRRLNSLKITNNVITRTYGSFRGDGADVIKWRYTGIDLVPLNTQSPTQLTVSGNTIKLLGTPLVKEYFPFEFNGIRMRLIAQEDGTWRDPDLIGSTEALHRYAGASITGNTVQSDMNFGIGIHASNQKVHWNDTLKVLVVDQVYDSLQGVTLSGNKFINLKSAITGSLNGALLSTNSCTTVTATTGCQQ